MGSNYDSLNSWKEENGMKTSKGEIKHYAGGSEYDPTAEAIRSYMEEQKRRNQKQSGDLER